MQRYYKQRKRILVYYHLRAIRLKEWTAFPHRTEKKHNQDWLFTNIIATSWTGSPFREKGLTIARYKGAWFQAHLIIIIPIFTLDSI